ncbi:MAG: tryptophan synthase subunit alpha [Anaerosomatales bacterium]|nr:tryptophan synthase subunit alpha [Anaerosomatales bacterium]
MTAERPGSRLEAAFRKGQPALVVYLMAGYPDREASLRALHTVADAGADVIELGVPYGDPLADGPVIAEAARVARSVPGGFGLAETIEMASEFVDARGEMGPPLVLMTYLNPLMRLGLSESASRMRGAGVAGVIVPDMPVEAARPWLGEAHGLDTVFLAAPTSTDDRIRAVCEASAGFVYCVSSLGVTGERDRLSDAARALVERVKAQTSLPAAVGFGISSAEQAAEAAEFADGVIVGSAVVRRQQDPDALAALVAELAEAVHGAERSAS